MSPYNRQKQETEQEPLIIISSTVKDYPKPLRICWNTGEEKNCSACYLGKGCKARI